MSAFGSKLRKSHDHSIFWCPGCDEPHVLDAGPGGWQFNRDGDRPTFAPSILVNRGRANPRAHVCHSFVRDGRVEFLGDCTHALAGQTVDVPDWPRPHWHDGDEGGGT